MAANPQPVPEQPSGRRFRNQYVTAEELTALRADPKSNPHGDFVVCLECGQKLRSVSTGHLKSHALENEESATTWKDYQAKWPGVPMLSDGTRAATRRAAVRFAHKDLAAHRQKSADWRANNPKKVKAQWTRAKERRRANPEPDRITDRKWYRKARIPKASDAELQVFLNDPGQCRYVVCLESGCRAKLQDIGCAHLPKIHGLTSEEYSNRHPGVPIKAIARIPKKLGRPATRTQQIKQAYGLHLQHPKWSWRQIAEKVVPQEHAKDPKAAAERIRVGVYELRKKSGSATP